MKTGLYLPNFTPFGSARAIADLARDAEQSGWDGLFIWDEMTGFDTDTVDPWVALAAAAVVTTRIRLGALITPLPRRRPWKVARETVSLDHLSGGRLIFGVGTGVGEPAWGDLGEESDPKIRGEMLDEGLAVLTGLWSAKPYTHSGPYYPIKQAQFLPGPLQQPRIPIWVGGIWPAKRPLRRMAAWDGMFPLAFGVANRQEELARLKSMIDTVKDLRAGNPAPFDVVLLGTTPLNNPAESSAIAAEYAAIGATWYLESIAPLRDGDPNKGPWSFEMLRAHVLEGPPQL
jgi:alkanesulfonate monooxygenase SsuD/methylene tetrahydromethanopterin reductase-like flavin-dependent oxidoreductase (luciferase family)